MASRTLILLGGQRWDISFAAKNSSLVFSQTRKFRAQAGCGSLFSHPWEIVRTWGGKAGIEFQKWDDRTGILNMVQLSGLAGRRGGGVGQEIKLCWARHTASGGAAPAAVDACLLPVLNAISAGLCRQWRDIPQGSPALNYRLPLGSPGQTGIIHTFNFQRISLLFF